jgi:hypothetical protein
MKKPIFLAMSVIVVALVAFMPARGLADSSAAPWQIETRPYRVLLDWRSDDRKNPAEPTELFLDTAKLASVTGAGALAPESFTFLAEKSDGSFERMPVATRDEVGQFNKKGTVFRFVPSPEAKQLWMYLGGNDQSAQELPTQWNLLSNAFDSMDSWQVSDPSVTATISSDQNSEAMHLVYDDKSHPSSNARVTITRSFSVPPDCRGVEAKVAFDVKADGENHIPFSILLEQFDESGKRLDACAVDPRWLAACLASGQDVNFREQGFIYPRTASIKLVFQVWCGQSRNGIMNSDGSWFQYPPSDNFQLQITRAEIRAAHPIAFPGYEQSIYAPGISGAKDDLSLAIGEGVGFCYDANPRSVWSEGALPSDPHAYGWPCGAGTFECWICPEWDKLDSGQRYILDAVAGIGALDNVLQIFYTPATKQFHVLRGDLDDDGQTEKTAEAPLTPGVWHHIAYTWDPSADRQQLFVDGAPVMNEPADPIQSIDITKLDSAKMIPGRVWLGQSSFVNIGQDRSLHGRIDEVRISDGLRYSGSFEPPRAAFDVDPDTRALFHFDGRTQGLIASDRGLIQGTLLSPAPPTSGTLTFEKLGGEQVLQAQWEAPNLPETLDPWKLFSINAYSPLTQSEFTNSSVDHQSKFHLKPGETASINCSSQPRMDWVEVRCPEDGTPLARPFLAKPGEVDPRTMQSLLASLKIQSLSTPRERADAIFKYLVAHNNYFWSTAQEIEPSGDVTDPGEEAILYLNGYPQYGCGEQNRMVRDCFLSAGLSSDMTHGSAHVFEQVFFDGSWHIYDLFARMFFPARDNQRPAALSEVERDPYLTVRVDRPENGYWLPSDTRIYQFPDREIAQPDMAYRLRPGEAFRYYWHNDARYNPLLANGTDHAAIWSDGPKPRGKPLHWANHFPPYIANGVFSFACTPRQDHPALSDWHDGSFVYQFFSPYVVCGAMVSASSDSGSAPTVEISYDQGNSWIPAPAASKDGSVDLERLCMARHLYWIRVTPPAGGKVAHFEHQAIVLMSPLVLTPVLEKGENTLSFTAESGSAADVTVQYHEENDAPLEVEGGARFGWLKGFPRQLLVCQPGGKTSFSVKSDSSDLSVIAPVGVNATKQSSGDNECRVDLNVPTTLADGLYPVTVKSRGRSRTIAILIAKHARLVSPDQASRHGDATMTTDPEGIRGNVLSLQPGAEVDFPLEGDGAGPLALFALAKIPEKPSTLATLALSSGPASIIEPNYAHEFWVQENLLYQWKWYHVRAGGYPWPTLASVNLADPSTAAINCTEGNAMISDVLVLPAQNESLVDAVTHYLFSGNYDPWKFEHDWGPVVTGVPYPVGK